MGKSNLNFCITQIVSVLSLFLKDSIARHKFLGLTVNFCQFIENKNPLSSGPYYC